MIEVFLGGIVVISGLVGYVCGYSQGSGAGESLINELKNELVKLREEIVAREETSERHMLAADRLIGRYNRLYRELLKKDPA